MRNLARLILFFTTLTLLVACSRQETLQGYLEGEYINLASNYPGTLQQLLIFRGNLVKKGQLLFVLDNEPEASQLAQAKAQLTAAQENLVNLEKGERQTVLSSILAQQQQAQASLELSAKNLTRYRQLLATGSIDKLTVDKAESDYQQDLNRVQQYKANYEEAVLGARTHAIKAQQATVAAAQADVEKYQWQLNQKSVYAPTDGRIFDTYYKVGEFVNSQQPVASLLAPRDIKLVFYIPEPERSRLALDQTVYFTCDGCDGRAEAKINYISPEAEYTPPVIFSRESRQKLVYRVEASLPLDVAKRFYPGQPVDVHVDRENRHASQ